MHKLMSTAALLGLFATPALSADVAPAPAADWTGFYVGANANWNFVSTDIHQPAQDFPKYSYPDVEIGNSVGNSIGGGLQLGYDYQIGSVLLGVQAMGNLTGASSDSSYTGGKVGSQLNGFGSLTGRLGFLVQPELLAYAKGGMALADFDYSDDGRDGYTFSGSDSEWRTGWTVGGGLEYRFAPNWSVFAEYDYADFGQNTYELDYKNGFWGDTFKYQFDQNMSTAMIGVNYRF